MPSRRAERKDNQILTLMAGSRQPVVVSGRLGRKVKKSGQNSPQSAAQKQTQQGKPSLINPTRSRIRALEATVVTASVLLLFMLGWLWFAIPPTAVSAHSLIAVGAFVAVAVAPLGLGVAVGCGAAVAVATAFDGTLPTVGTAVLAALSP